MPRCVRMSRSGRHRMRIISSEMVSVHGNQLASADSAVERDISRGDPVVSFIHVPWQANIWRVKQNIVWRPRSPIASIHELSAANIGCTTCDVHSRVLVISVFDCQQPVGKYCVLHSSIGSHKGENGLRTLKLILICSEEVRLTILYSYKGLYTYTACRLKINIFHLISEYVHAKHV